MTARSGFVVGKILPVNMYKSIHIGGKSVATIMQVISSGHRSVQSGDMVLYDSTVGVRRKGYSGYEGRDEFTTIGVHFGDKRCSIPDKYDPIEVMYAKVGMDDKPVIKEMIGEWCLIKRDETVSSEGAIYLPDSATYRKNTGVVVMAGPKSGLSAGMLVIYHPEAPVMDVHPSFGDKIVVIHAQAIEAII